MTPREGAWSIRSSPFPFLVSQDQQKTRKASQGKQVESRMVLLTIISRLMGASSRCCSKSKNRALLLPSFDSRKSTFELIMRAWAYPPCSSSSTHSYRAILDRPEVVRSSDGSNTSRVNANTHSNSPKMTYAAAPRGPTPQGKQFESWIQTLKPGFGPEDVGYVLEHQRDPDLALDIFHWTAQQRTYKHNHHTYQIMIEKLASGKRYKQMESLIEEVMAGACVGSESLFNTMIYHHCQTKMLWKAVNVYKKMQKTPNCKATLKTYNMLLNALVAKFTNLNVCFVYLHAVRSLYKQMNAAGVAPDLFTLNLLIKAYSRSLEMDEALRVFREMGLYGCSPNVYTFNYIIKGLCEKGRTKVALSFYSDMLNQGFLPSQSVLSVLVSTLSVGGRLQEAAKILVEMTDRGLAPDFLTYKTLLNALCKSGKEQEAFRLLRELHDKDRSLDGTTYRRLMDSLELTD